MQVKPVIRDDVSAPFFDAASRGELDIQICEDCSRPQFVSIGATAGMKRCRHCASKRVGWTRTEPRGHLVSFIVVHARPAADGTAPPPTVGGIVELAAGPWLYVTIDADPADLHVGQPMTIELAPTTDGETVPYARPTERS